MTEISMFFTTNIYCICPNPKCGERVENWHADPKGSTTTCDYCECEIKISKDIDIELGY